jgi:hypothetical protein
MKKLLYTFLAVSIIFSACKKEEEEPINDSNLLLENTIWEFTKIEALVSAGQMQIFNIPEDLNLDHSIGSGYEISEWIFLDDILIFHTIYSDEGIPFPTSFYDTISYSYQNNIITTDPQGFGLSGINPIEDSFEQYALNPIIEYNSNSLKLQSRYGEFITLEKQ